jgi:hypothetical protein
LYDLPDRLNVLTLDADDSIVIPGCYGTPMRIESKEEMLNQKKKKRWIKKRKEILNQKEEKRNIELKNDV